MEIIIFAKNLNTNGSNNKLSNFNTPPHKTIFLVSCHIISFFIASLFVDISRLLFLAWKPHRRGKNAAKEVSQRIRDLDMKNEQTETKEQYRNGSYHKGS
jgi:hypothetical protein